MKKIVLTFGLASGIALSAMMLATLPFHDQMSFGTALIIGYTTMVAAGLVSYFGVRRYRDTVGGGKTTFARAFSVGMLICLISSACYTVTWEAVYFGVPGFATNFVARYKAAEVARERAKGTPPAELERKRVEMERQWQQYQNPAINAAMTFAEPLPVGLIVALLSAAALSRRRGTAAAGVSRASMA